MDGDERRTLLAGEVTIDLGHRCIYRDGVEQALRPKAFAVLLELIHHRDRVLTKQELVDSVWDGAVITEDVLVQCIVDIRKALQDDPRKPRYIRTMPKVGYRFIGPVEEAVSAKQKGTSVEQEPAGPLGEAAISQTPAQRRPRIVWAVASVFAAALLVPAVIYFARSLTSRAAGRVGQRVVPMAVLPFVNLTGNPEDEYLTDGITDELANGLAGIRGVRMISRSSSFQFKGKSEDIRSIGTKLKAEAVLEGSVKRAGDRLRIVARLSSSADGLNLWSGDYETDLKSVPSVANRIALDVAARLDSEIRSGGLRRAQVSAEAYDLYLRGRYLWNRRTPDSLRRSIELFQGAIAREPGYALGYAGLADSYSVLVSNGYPGARELAPKAIAAARKAVELDATLADPHAALAAVLSTYQWDWSTAELEFKRALDLNPDSATAHHWFALHLQRLLRLDEGLREILAAERLDPVSLMVATNVGGLYFAMRRYDEAAAKMRAVLDLDPNFFAAGLEMGVALTEAGRYDEGRAQLRKLAEQTGDPGVSGALVYNYAKSGKLQEARDLLRQLEHRKGNPILSALDFAGLHAMVGDTDLAFQLIERAFDDRSALADIQLDTRLLRLHDDPRYAVILKRIGFPPSR